MEAVLQRLRRQCKGLIKRSFLSNCDSPPVTKKGVVSNLEKGFLNRNREIIKSKLKGHKNIKFKLPILFLFRHSIIAYIVCFTMYATTNETEFISKIHNLLVRALAFHVTLFISSEY